MKQRPRGSQNGVQMVPKPSKNEIRILTRKATSKKTSKYQIRTLFAMFAACPGPPKNRLFGQFLETKPSPGAFDKGPAKLLAKRCSLSPKNSRKVAPEGPQMGAKIHQKSDFGASGTPRLQPTGPRDAQEGVNHPNWSQKS